MEIEIKVRIENGETLKRFLEQEASQSYVERQIDEYYTPAHKDFTDADPIKEWLRLRNSDGKFSLNYKNWHYGSDGKSHHCDEYETEIGNVDDTKKILSALDFKHLITVDKLRSAWRYKEYEIALDTVEGLGDFVEIEYKGRDADVVPSEITEQMMSFLDGIGCGAIERTFKGYPYLLLEKKAA